MGHSGGGPVGVEARTQVLTGFLAGFHTQRWPFLQPRCFQVACPRWQEAGAGSGAVSGVAATAMPSDAAASDTFASFSPMLRRPPIEG